MRELLGQLREAGDVDEDHGALGRPPRRFGILGEVAQQDPGHVGRGGGLSARLRLDLRYHARLTSTRPDLPAHAGALLRRRVVRRVELAAEPVGPGALERERCAAARAQRHVLRPVLADGGHRVRSGHRLPCHFRAVDDRCGRRAPLVAPWDSELHATALTTTADVAGCATRAPNSRLTAMTNATR